METQKIIEAMQVLENFSSNNPQEIKHHKGVDEMGNYEYFTYGKHFSSPNLQLFIQSVSRRWRN